MAQDELDDIGNGFCCTECGEFCAEDEWNDGDICNGCRGRGLKFLNERGLKSSFIKWQKESRQKK